MRIIAALLQRPTEVSVLLYKAHGAVPLIGQANRGRR